MSLALYALAAILLAASLACTIAPTRKRYDWCLGIAGASGFSCIYIAVLSRWAL